MATKPMKADFAISIDFQRGSESPARVFRAMTGLIDAFQEIDRGLARTIDINIEPVLLLEDVETGSLRVWLTTLLKEVDDEALKKLDWKTAVGKYLVKAKYLIINFMEGKTTVSDHTEVEALRRDLLSLAKETDVLNIPVYQPVSTRMVLNDLELLTRAVSPLGAADKAIYTTKDDASNFNLSFSVAPESLEAIVTRETIESDGTMILVVKKPDYLGESMWDFRHSNRTLQAKLLDYEWLKKFQNREVEVRPGDAIRARVKVRTSYDHDGEVIGEHYEVIEVIEVLQKMRSLQADLPTNARTAGAVRGGAGAAGSAR